MCFAEFLLLPPDGNQAHKKPQTYYSILCFSNRRHGCFALIGLKKYCVIMVKIVNEKLQSSL